MAKTDGKTGLSYLWAMAAEHPVAAACLFFGTVIAFVALAHSDNSGQGQSGPASNSAALQSIWDIGQIPLGTSEDEARSHLGPPSDSQEMNTQGYVTHCLYYPDNWQLCFDNGTLPPHHALKLTTKNHY